MELFHEVTITAAHYIELQKRLSELNPGRDLLEYQAEHVQALKLDVLRSFNASFHPISPNHVDDEDDNGRNDEDREHSSGLDDDLLQLFPTTIRYLDLSSLKLEKRPQRIPLLLLIRQEYGLISNLLDELPKDSAGSAIISGQPGIGKVLVIYPLNRSHKSLRQDCLPSPPNDREDDCRTTVLVSNSQRRCVSCFREHITYWILVIGRRFRHHRFRGY